MSLFQQPLSKCLSHETLMSLSQNSSYSNAQGSQNPRFNFQLKQNDVDGSALLNELTGNTLNSIGSCFSSGNRLSPLNDDYRSAEEQIPALDLIEEYLNFGDQQQQQREKQQLYHVMNSSMQAAEGVSERSQDRNEQSDKHGVDGVPREGRRLSISEYESDKPVYYEYEHFTPGMQADAVKGDGSAMAEGEDLSNYSYLLMSPESKMRKDSIFSDYGNQMVMPLPTLAQNHLQLESIAQSAGAYHTPQWRKMKERLKWNIFGAGSKPDLAVAPVSTPTAEEGKAQQSVKKRHFWSRKASAPVSREEIKPLATLDLPQEEISINPIKLVRPSMPDLNQFDFTAIYEPEASPQEEETHEPQLEDFSAHLQNDPNMYNLHYRPVTSTEIIPTALASSEAINSISKLSTPRKRIGIPKTRGRKPSPALDATKPFGCEFCDRRFKRQEHLKRHVRSLHIGEKPYDCEICGKKFSRSDNLNQHIKTHLTGSVDRR